MLGFLRREFPSLRLVLGGGLVTSWLQKPSWRIPFDGLVDEMVSGPGNILCSASWGKIPDLKSGNALPRFSGLPLAQYLSPGLILPYATSSGCYWGRCSFCPERAEGNQYCPLAPDLVVTQLRTLTAEMRPALFHLVDNAISPALMERMARAARAGLRGFRLRPGMVLPALPDTSPTPIFAETSRHPDV